jgi:hypothetical protein
MEFDEEHLERIDNERFFVCNDVVVDVVRQVFVDVSGISLD